MLAKGGAAEAGHQVSATQVVQQGTDIADMCGFTVDLVNERWCFHLVQPSSEFDIQPGQSVAYCCEAAFTVDLP